MIASFGILSLLQMTIIPGLIFAKIFRLKGFFEILISSIGISPIFNYFFVSITTIAGIYTRTVVLICFIIELMLCLVLYYPVLIQNEKKNVKPSKVSLFFLEYLKSKENQSAQWTFIIHTIYFSAFFLALGSVLYYIKLFAFPATSTFVSWDAVVSWNRWTIDWYHNQLPFRTLFYPQLIPTNWSLTYQFMGTDQVKIFIKIYMGFVEVFVPLAIFALGVIKRKVSYFFCTFITALLQIRFGSLSSGYVDTTIAFFGLLSIIFLFLSQENENKIKYLLLGALFAAGAALTKQAGLWIVITYFVLTLILHKEMIRKKSTHLLVRIGLIDIVMIAPWYVYKQIQINMGQDYSGINYIFSLASQGKTTLQVFTSAIQHILLYFNNPLIPGEILFALLATLLILVYKHIFWRKILIIVVLPYVVIWIFFFSYDMRNFNLIVPLIGVIAGIGLYNISKLNINFQKYFAANSSIDLKFTLIKLINRIERIIPSIKPLYLLIGFAIITSTLPLFFPDSQMIAKSIEDQKFNVDAELNQSLYDYHETYGFHGKILTDYQILNYLPGLEDYYLAGDQRYINFIDKLQQPEVFYGLTKVYNMQPEVKKYYDELIAENCIKPIFTSGKYEFFSVCHTITE